MTATTDRFCFYLGMPQRESVIENVIGHAAAKRDSLRLVKGPMDAEIDSALPVFFFSL